MKKRTVLRSAAALMLTIVLLLAMALPALAVPANGSITILPNGQAKVGDATRFTAYQVFKGELSAVENQLVNLEWGDGVKSAELLEAMLSSGLSVGSGTFGQAFTTAHNNWKNESLGAGYSDEMNEDEFVAQWLAREAQTNPLYADVFARIAAAHIETGSGHPSQYAGVDGSGGWTISGLTPGYYLVIDNYTNGQERPDGSVSSYILQVLGNEEVDLKATIPIVEKDIVKGDGTLADGILTETETAVNYRLTGSVAENIDEYKEYKYVFTDKLSAGLTMSQDDLNKLTVTLNGDTTQFDKSDYEASISPDVTQEGVEHTLTVTFNDLKAALKKANSALDLSDPDVVKAIRVWVNYTAHLNKNAVVGSAGNLNDVFLTYSNDPYATGTGQSVTDEVKTYTLALKILKKDTDGGALQDVKFKLMQGTIDDPTAGADNYFAEFSKVTGVSETYQEFSGWQQGSIESTGTELTTDAQGVFNIHGLSAGTYTLVETEAPAGYETMKPIVFTITGEVSAQGGALSPVSLALDASNEHRQDVEFTGHLTNNSAQLALTNFKSPILPHTGGIGARVVYIVSGLTVLAGAAIVVMAMRKRTRGRHEQSR